MTALHVEVRDGAAELRLNRPELPNRFDEVLLAELGPALTALGDDVAVRAVVWTSTGKHFSTGVVALHGHTLGVATSLVLLADAIVTTPTVRLGDPHVHMALVAGDGGATSWPVNLPLLRAKRHLLWGEPMSGRDAFDLGLVTDLVDSPDKVCEVAFELAARVAALPPIAVQLTKATLNAGLAARVDELLDVGFANEAISNRSADVPEAIAAFKEGRPGRWTGA